MSERQLVTVRTIYEKKPIPKADFIEAVRVDGWWVVAKKDEFQVGDSVLYFEIDSVLPDVEPFKFLTEKNLRTFYNGKVGARLRTVKLRGQISQGLVVSLSDLPFLDLYEDLAEQLGVWKYDPPILGGQAGDPAGNWPNWLPKTNQERVQNIDLTEEQYSGLFAIEEKVDGTSMSIWIDDDGVLGVGSHNISFKCGPGENLGNAYVETAKQYMDILLAIPEEQRPFAIQGELLGPKIQSNPYQLVEREFRLFDIFQPKNGGKWPAGVRRWWGETHGFKQVPLIALGLLNDLVGLVLNDRQAIVDYADGESKITPGVPREGLVFKALDDGNVSFKAISNARLLQDK